MSKEKPIGLGIVGIGRAGWGMHCGELESRKDKFQIVAACDIIPERCAQMAERYGCQTYRRIEDLVKDPAVEVVDIATRSVDHVKHSLIALAAGKKIFLEKPMAVSYAEAKRLQPAAKRGLVFIRHNRRFEPGFQHIREIIASGVLGDVFEIKLRRNSFGRRGDWQTLKKCGGGQLLNWGPHIIDHALRFLESPVADVWSDLKRVAALGDAEDHLKIVLRGKNGRVVDLEISGGAALGEPECIVLGTRGALVTQGANLHLRHIDPKQKLARLKASPATPGTGSGFGSTEELKWIDTEIPVAPALGCTMTTIWDSLYETVRHGKRFPIAFDEALEVMRIVSLVRKGTPFNT